MKDALYSGYFVFGEIPKLIHADGTIKKIREMFPLFGYIEHLTNSYFHQQTTAAENQAASLL
ncbi:Uncharacterized protein dnm_072410 [Desulfonema magnum]|uniref:Uncharacterized protein n=1 Tax=Desulfonema magnum TaxID=45655 RepID=A0A975BT52_9BACT|nr:Uncharacterized protein dnm_072410 [Desulfonema magnum]